MTYNTTTQCNSDDTIVETQYNFAADKLTPKIVHQLACCQGENFGSDFYIKMWNNLSAGTVSRTLN